MNKLTGKDIAKMIDHSLLRPEMTEKEIVEECRVAREYDVATVCVRPYDVALCKKLLAGSNVLVSVVVGFPHGNSTIEAKYFEAKKALDDGATELDLVLPIGKVCSEQWVYVEQELRTIVNETKSRGAILKVIFENYYLTADQIAACCILCEKIGVEFVKTSTGYAPGGATIEDVKLMRENCSPSIQIKAAGGIRDLKQFMLLYQAGATRQGTRSTKEIIEEALLQERDGKL